MRVLHVCDSLNPAGLGGYESYLHYLSKEMARRGHSSKIIAQSPNRKRIGVEHHPHYNIEYIPGNFLEARKWEFFSIPEEQRDSAAQEMFNKNDIDENTDILCDQLLKVIDQYKPSIIHAHSTYVVFNRVIEQLKAQGSISNPTIITVHGLPKPLILPGNIITSDFQQLATHCPFDAIMGVSEAVTHELRGVIDQSIPCSIETLYLGIDLEIFRPMTDVEKTWDLAFMGRLEHMKSVDLFPDILENLRKTHPSTRMLITGDGSLRESLFHEIEQRSLMDMVDYLGVVDSKSVPQLINASRIFLYPSRREPFGLSIIEAMACRVPVITSNVYGPKEIVTNLVNGVSIDPEDPDQIADRIRNLLDDGKLGDRLAENALNMVSTEYDMKIHCDNLLSRYNSLEMYG